MICLALTVRAYCRISASVTPVCLLMFHVGTADAAVKANARLNADEKCMMKMV